MYAGYVNVDKTNNRNLYYWFVESQGNAASDPVILWLNGGVCAGACTRVCTAQVVLCARNHCGCAVRRYACACGRWKWVGVPMVLGSL
jgi:hypothetical protein